MFVSCRHSATTEANGNRSRGENGGNKINPDGIKTTSLIVFILLLVMLILLGLTLFIFNKKRKKEKGNSMSLCVVLLWLWMLFNWRITRWPGILFQIENMDCMSPYLVIISSQSFNTNYSTWILAIQDSSNEKTMPSCMGR